jgi:hypothetical protein
MQPHWIYPLKPDMGWSMPTPSKIHFMLAAALPPRTVIMPGELLTTQGNNGRTSLPSQVKIRQLATITTSVWSSQKHGKYKSA